MDTFLEWGKAIGGWISVIAAALAVAGAGLAAKFATRREMTEIIKRTGDNGQLIKDELMHVDNALNGRISILEQGVERLNIALKNTPTRQELHETQMDMRKLEGSINVLAQRMEGMTELMGKIEQPLNLLVEYHMNLDRRS